MSIDSRTRLDVRTSFILWIGIGGMVALILAFLPDSLECLARVLLPSR